ncbi:hypothetical protein ElyMa_000710200 [Elysia marginata]|uniref:Uncharacterized protein n=1 Tax=Elysia marginata TaxID=1093978 RepID=A0AAV4GL39_9GAST|nr:hypothetical protein ElyMa_000710200 [Elysia marginata]
MIIIIPIIIMIIIIIVISSSSSSIIIIITIVIVVTIIIIVIIISSSSTSIISHNGEEAIPMLMLNHADGKGDNPARSRAASNADKNNGPSLLDNVNASASCGAASMKGPDPAHPPGLSSLLVAPTAHQLTMNSTALTAPGPTTSLLTDDKLDKGVSPVPPPLPSVPDGAVIEPSVTTLPASNMAAAASLATSNQNLDQQLQQQQQQQPQRPSLTSASNPTTTTAGPGSSPSGPASNKLVAVNT